MSKHFKDTRQRKNFLAFMDSLAFTGSPLLSDVKLISPEQKHWHRALSHFFALSPWDATILEERRRSLVRNLLDDCACIAIDTTALVKSGKHFEREGAVYDGRDKSIHDGFPLLIATGVNKTEHYAPLQWKRYSQEDLDKKGENLIKEQFLKDVYAPYSGKGGKKPVFLGDSGFCRRNLLFFCSQHRIPFVVRTITRSIRLPSGEKMRTDAMKAGWYEGVQCMTRGWDAIACSVIVGPWDAESKARLVILTNLSSQEYSRTQVFKMYERRWYVEETIKQLKQNFGIEGFRMRRWAAGERFLTLAFLASALMQGAMRTHNLWIQQNLPLVLRLASSRAKQLSSSVYYCRQFLSKLLFCGSFSSEALCLLDKVALGP